MNEIMTEQPVPTRKPMDCNAFVYDTVSGERVGKLFNLAQDGFLLLTDRQLEAGQRMALTIELPNALSGHHSIELTAECLWCQPSDFSEEFSADFEIKTLSEQNLVALKYFVRDFSFAPAAVEPLSQE